MDLFQRIMEQVRNVETKLLSQILVSDNEYETLLNYTREKAVCICLQTNPVPDANLAIALVQIAIRAYEKGNYWDYFQEELKINIATNRRVYIGQIFISTLYFYDLFVIEREADAKTAYVENIKAHSFVPNNYLLGYYDFLYSFYDRNLFRQIEDHLEEDLLEMIDFFENSLSSAGDVVKIEDFGNRPSKSYRLLKATRVVFAQCTSVIICKLITSHLKMIDAYYYDGIMPNISERYGDYFNKWTEMRDSEINKDITHRKKRRSFNTYYHKPHFEIDRQNGKSFLYIPEQKIRDDDFSGSAVAVVRFNKTTKNIPLSVYRAYGAYVTELIRCEIEDIFFAYSVDIVSEKTRSFEIPKKQYRIFDEGFEETNKLKKGNNYLLVEKRLRVRCEFTPVYINTAHQKWDEYSFAGILDDTVIYIENQPISIVGEFSDKPYFEYVSKEFTLEMNNQPVQTAYRHPIISFIVSKSVLLSTWIWCNFERFSATFEQTCTVVELGGDGERCGVTVKLENLLIEVDGRYQIWVDEPGKKKKLICDYVLITRLRCQTDKPRYIFCDTASIYFEGNYDLTPINCESVGCKKFSIGLTTGTEEALFSLKLENSIFKLSVPLYIFKYGFSKVWKYNRLEYLWHTKLQNDLYIRMPGATAALVYFGGESNNCIYGEVGENGEFRFEISRFVQLILESDKVYEYLNVKYYDNKWRNLSLFKIQKRLHIESVNLTQIENIVFLDAKFFGESQLFVRILDFKTKNIIFEKAILNRRTELPEICPDGLYIIEKYEIVQDSFGLTHTAKSCGKPIYKIGVINWCDLSNCKIQINGIYYEGSVLAPNYYYAVFDLIKVDDYSYIGKLAHKPRIMQSNGKFETVCERVRVETVFDERSEQLQVFSMRAESDEGCCDLFYDTKANRIVDPDDDLLQRSKDYNRFITFYDDCTDFSVEFRRVR